jgi:hypothetical protein
VSSVTGLQKYKRFFKRPTMKLLRAEENYLIVIILIQTTT